MTRQEILEGLYEIKNWKCNGDAKTHEVVTETIKILEQEPVIDKIRAEVERLQKMCNRNNLNLMKQYLTLGMVLDIIDKYKAESEVEK